ncbi:UDP-N-acetylmuramoyl-tripeptide--D-alanyl-D-alanine ligase [Agaricicola taiwanensis]|uniref:UDP-N-acetylmuramoyl-tripeptide--D-alanyl-D-alanine ligase n=1 Tax=Agaricicola taiwanensis TaxID=591372 RepID=A0A8J2VY48_9RHOB|nr:UDP-N-acetylmuramoylalanyl-D-glutamyl-2,6-diaminopimelate--D-alanyl-D-alanine ligase [Agaricicola taiwanensis]GGE42302.1 UDP-N-acetylmuramoyl-tripeptide--D-alanyl-D-alanine ligase [Agaricicola taiwanensis]
MSDKLWSTAALATAMKAEVRGEPADWIGGISIDTRTLEESDAYFSIKGEVHDGHAFAGAALAKGAALAVIAEDKADELEAVTPALIVPDVLKALEDAGRASRERCKGRIVAVTGSVGKTGTKEMLRLGLEGQGATHASVASYNNHWGVPLTLARMPADTRYGIFEIGMNHAGEIIPLTKMVQPDVAIITTVEPVHIAHFPSIEAIADAKAEIFFGVKRGGVVVLNRDNGQFERLVSHAKALGLTVATFGSDASCDARLVRADPYDNGSMVTAVVAGEPTTYRLGAAGRHLVLNSLAALLAIHHLGGDVNEAVTALSEFTAPKGRGARITLKVGKGQALLIDESYNANPASMRAALAVLGTTPAEGRRIAVLGDMLELGTKAGDLHVELADAVEANADLLFAAGESMRGLYDVLPAEKRGAWAPTSAELTPSVLAAIQPDDTITVKGSLGSRMGPIVEALAQRFATESKKGKGKSAGAQK